MKEYNIWSEGFIVMEGRSGAYYHGKIKANSFKEACDNYFKNDSLYSPERMTYWGCKLFDNEQEARKSYG